MPRKKKASEYRGVIRGGRNDWIVRIRAHDKTYVNRRCKTELEAALIYNAVAKVVWQDRAIKLNETPRQKMGDFGTSAGNSFWVGSAHYVLVDQRPTAANSWDYRRLCQYDWFYRDGFATCAHYDRERGLILTRMHELIMGGPCVHINGKTLDNRRANLMSSDPKLPIIQPQVATAPQELPAVASTPPAVAQDLPAASVVLRPGRPGAVLEILGQPEVRPESYEVDI